MYVNRKIENIFEGIDILNELRRGGSDKLGGAK